jgi:hypothetical protein
MEELHTYLCLNSSGLKFELWLKVEVGKSLLQLLKGFSGGNCDTFLSFFF